MRKKREERQQKEQEPVQNFDIDTLIPALKNTNLYDKFLDEVESQKPEDYDEAIEWVEENNPYDDENFKEWLQSNYTAEQLKYISTTGDTRQVDSFSPTTHIKR